MIWEMYKQLDLVGWVKYKKYLQHKYKNDTHGKVRRVTGHRLLTSDEIIQSKKDQERHKRKLEQVKEERKRKRAEKRVDIVKSVKTEETNKAVYCIICKIKYVDNTKFDWVACDVYDRWMHQICVPQYRQEHMKGTIDKDTSFE